MKELFDDDQSRRRLHTGVDPDSAEQFVAELLGTCFVRRKCAHHHGNHRNDDPATCAHRGIRFVTGAKMANADRGVEVGWLDRWLLPVALANVVHPLSP